MREALIIGKFYPPHAGHEFLIQRALDECSRVNVLVQKSDPETISLADRIGWLGEIFPDAHIYGQINNNKVGYTEETWKLHMETFFQAINDYQLNPTVIYSSEEYGAELARRLHDDCPENLSDRYMASNKLENVVVDINRTVTSGISASSIRSKPRDYWDFLSGPVRRSLAKRIVVCGAESSGTSTLARDLAKYFKTTYAFEYGRYYVDMVGEEHDWSTEDFLNIAKNQTTIENQMAEFSRHGLVICDTDLLVTQMYHDLWISGQSEKLWRRHRLHRMQFPADLYLVTAQEEVPFEDDGQRTNEKDRAWQEAWLTSTLTAQGLPWKLVTGGRKERVAAAAEAIANVHTWKFGVPLEYQS